MLLEVDDIRGVKPFVLDVLQRPPKRFMKVLHRIIHLNPSRANGVSFIKGLNKNPPTSQDRYLDFVSNLHFFVPASFFKRIATLRPARDHRKHSVHYKFWFSGAPHTLNPALFLFGFLLERFGTIFANVNKNRLKNKHLIDFKANISVRTRSTVGKRLSTDLSTELPVPVISIDGGH